MNKFFPLVRVLFKSEDALDLSSGKKSTHLKGILKLLGLGLLLLLAGASFAPLIAKLYEGMAPTGTQGQILTLLMISSSLLVLIFAFFYVMSVFYFSSDIENYLFLPIKPGTLVLAKFCVVAIYEIGSTVVLFMPSFITYGIVSQAGPQYYITMVFAMILLPMIPLAVMSILCMLLMRFSKLFRNKDRFTLFSTIFGIASGLSANFLIQGVGSAKTSVLPTEPLARLSRALPAVHFLDQAFQGDLGMMLWNVAIVAALSTAAIFIAFQVGQLVYIDGAKGLKESGSKRKALTKAQISSSTKRSGPVMALARKEMKVILRTPPYFINCVLMTFLMPFFFIVPFVLQLRTPEVQEAFRSFSWDLVRQMVPVEMITFGLVSLLLFYSGLNMITATAMSREGANFSLLRTLPLTPGQMIAGKVLPGIFISLLGASLLILPALILLRPNPLYAGLGLLTGLLGNLMINLLAITLDIHKPRLNWTTEQRAVKQNFTAFFSSMISMVLSAAPFLLHYWVKFPFIPVLVGLLILFALLSVLLLLFLPGFTERSLGKVH
ncbi:hypothetical protein ABB02_01718 [Clostridiaceae bacterium JG1575]|nr:hypothetical protein ABB02_01718 [Clostridiaceae bacterium JG1575]